MTNNGIDWIVDVARARSHGMHVTIGFPPMIDEIDAAFRVRREPIVYAWGKTIYATNGIRVTPDIMVHESVHGLRQGGDVEGWWRRYIAEPEFRLAEEVPAHVAQFIALCELEPGRAARRRALAVMADRLSAPLYGRLVSKEAAKRIIRDAAEKTLAKIGA